MANGGMMSPALTPLCPWPESPTMLAISTVITTYGFDLLAVAWQIVTLCNGSGWVADASDAHAPTAPNATKAVTVTRAVIRRIRILRWSRCCHGQDCIISD